MGYKDMINMNEIQKGSYFGGLLKLSSKFLIYASKKEATPNDIVILKDKLIEILNNNKNTLYDTMKAVENLHREIENKISDKLDIVHLHQISNCMDYLLNLTNNLNNINPFIPEQSFDVFNSTIFSLKYAFQELEKFKPKSLPITVPSYGFGEENAGQIEAEQAYLQFGDFGFNSESLINGERTIDLAQIINEIITEAQAVIKKMITMFSAEIDEFLKRKYYLTEKELYESSGL